MRHPIAVCLAVLLAVGMPAAKSTNKVSVSPKSLTFASQQVGTTSPAQTVTLTNVGSSTVTITSITITGTNSGDFAQTNTCGTSLAGGAKCTINVTFTPTATGTRTGSLSISDNAGGSPQKVSLTGTGASSGAPTVSLSPPSLTFANQNVGTTSAAQAVTLTNGGTGTLTITSITLTGTNSTEFAQTNTCGTSVTAGANCTISVTFTPAANGFRTASINVADNAAGSPQTVSLTGTGVTPAASLSPTSLTFSSQQVNTTSPAQAVTLTNGGTGTLTITSITFSGTNSGDFAQTNTCGSSVIAGATCTINVTFTPTATGTRTATLTVSDDATGSPQTVSLAGTGTQAGGGGASGTLPAVFFGMNYHCAVSGSCPPKDTNGTVVPIKSIRWWDTGTTKWKDLEPSCDGGTDPNNPCYNWAGLDSLMQKKMSESTGQITDTLFAFGHSPNWATGCSSDTCPPSDLNSDGSGANQFWINFVTAFHTRYGPTSTSCFAGAAAGDCYIRFYEVWNEGNAAIFWTGSYAQLARMAYDIHAIVSGDAGGSEVLTPSFAGSGSDQATAFTNFLPATEAGHSTTGAQDIDILNFHGRDTDAGVPEHIQNILVQDLPLWQQYAPGKPYWMTEGGWRPCNVNPAAACNSGQGTTGADNDVNIQAAYVARYFLLMMNSTDSTGQIYSVARSYWYNWDVSNCFGSLYALSTNFSTCWGGVTGAGPTISATAWTQLANWTTGSKFTAPCTLISPLWQCTITEANGKTGVIVWANDWPSSAGQNFTVPAGYVDYLDLLGGSTTVTPGEVVSIGIKPIMFETQ